MPKVTNGRLHQHVGVQRWDSQTRKGRAALNVVIFLPIASVGVNFQWDCVKGTKAMANHWARDRHRRGGPARRTRTHTAGPPIVQCRQGGILRASLLQLQIRQLAFLVCPVIKIHQAPRKVFPLNTGTPRGEGSGWQLFGQRVSKRPDTSLFWSEKLGF